MTAPALTSTPFPTKVALVATVAAAVAAVGVFAATRSDPVETGDAAAYLCLLSGFFLLRVAGQVLVRLRRPSWLPPTAQWNLSPYRLLLPAQVAILALMAWIDSDFARNAGFWTRPRPTLGSGVLWFALVYASAMLVRYVVRMSRRPEERWFGGAIPIVFHWVLAGYLFVFGSFHASH
jgi:hypothetical protein